MPRRLKHSLAVGALALAAAAAAWPCGFEGPNSVASQRGMMNLAFPQSAYVRTAIWQAQMAGDLPRDALARRDDLTPQARGMVQLIRATWLLKTLAARSGNAPDAAEHPAVAVVLMGPMLWSRIEPKGAGARVHTHVSGPESGEVVPPRTGGPGHKPSFTAHSEFLPRSAHEWQVSGDESEPQFG